MAMTEEQYRKLRRSFWLRNDYDRLKKLQKIWWAQTHPEEVEAQRKKDEIAQKEDEVHRLLQKNPDDLIGREIRRLKELSKDPDIDMDDILTRKEFAILSEVINDTPKEKTETQDSPSNNIQKSLFGEPLFFSSVAENEYIEGKSDEESAEEEMKDEEQEEEEENSLRNTIEGGYIDILDYAQRYRNRFRPEGHYVIPSGIKKIGPRVFCNCDQLISVEIPNSVTAIYESAFEGCLKLKLVAIPKGVRTIKEAVFKNCKNLTTIELHSGITSIGDSAFEGCNKLSSIKIPGGVKKIGKNAFCRCSRLTEIEIPSSVTTIGKGAFSFCSKLEKLIVPKRTKQRFAQMEGLKKQHAIIVEE